MAISNYTVPNNFENVTTLKEMLAVPNATTGGYTYIGLMVMMQVIIMIALIPFGFEVAILSSAFIAMVASLFLLSAFTGYLASAMTVKKLTESPATLADLYTAKVAVVKGSTAQLKLSGLGIKHHAVRNLEEALNKFNAGNVDVVVHDDAMLKYAASSIDGVSVWSIENSTEDYAIALPPNSPLTKGINLGILKILASPEWKAIQLKHNVL